MRLTIEVPSRIHLTLVDLGQAGYRQNGGAGFFIAKPSATLTFGGSAQVNLRLLEILGFDQGEIKSLTSLVEVALDACGGVNGIGLEYASSLGHNQGFGLGTAIALSCMEAVGAANGHVFSEATLKRLSGRGGASGVGLHGYFRGGFLLDVGRKANGSKLTSSDDIVGNFQLPTRLARINMPPWPVGIVIPPGSFPASRDRERALFNSHLPLADEDIHEAAYHLTFGVAASVLDSDFEGFCSAINSIQKCAWKRLEIESHGGGVAKCMAVLNELGCDAVGMSSMGPALFYFAADFEVVSGRVDNMFGSKNHFVSCPDNSGRKLSNG